MTGLFILESPWTCVWTNPSSTILFCKISSTVVYITICVGEWVSECYQSLTAPRLLTGFSARIGSHVWDTSQPAGSDRCWQSHVHRQRSHEPNCCYAVGTACKKYRGTPLVITAKYFFPVSTQTFFFSLISWNLCLDYSDLWTCFDQLFLGEHYIVWRPSLSRNNSYVKRKWIFPKAGTHRFSCS